MAFKLWRPLKAMLKDTPLVINIGNKDFMYILLSGKKDLTQWFSDIDVEIVRQQMKKSTGNVCPVSAKLEEDSHCPNVSRIPHTFNEQEGLIGNRLPEVYLFPFSERLLKQKSYRLTPFPRGRSTAPGQNPTVCCFHSVKRQKELYQSQLF